MNARWARLVVAGMVREKVDAGGWWQQAACVGRDPGWWADHSDHRSLAVKICLSCPVREQCLAEAVESGDIGVIRAGWVFSLKGNRRRVGSLICSHCGAEPVHSRWGALARYCSSRCAALAGVGGPDDADQPREDDGRSRADVVQPAAASQQGSWAASIPA